MPQAIPLDNTYQDYRTLIEGGYPASDHVTIPLEAHNSPQFRHHMISYPILRAL